jgi:hypothetical protein
MQKIFLILILSIFYSCSVFSIDRSQLDPNHLIPQELLKQTLIYFDNHQKIISNKQFIGIIDFRPHSSKERFFVIDLESGKIEKYLVAHGKNSDPNFDGLATKFSNVIDSKMSSLGFYLSAETYEGEHGYSLRLDGLSDSNSNARERAIVIHSADYVYPGEKIGRSYGCPAVEPRYHRQIINKLKEGALINASY